MTSFTKDQLKHLIKQFKPDGPSTPIEFLKLSTRTYSSLLSIGIESVEHLEMTPEYLLPQIQGLGKKALADLIKKHQEFKTNRHVISHLFL